MRHYTVVLEYDPEVGAYSAVVPALPGCASQGPTVDQALAHAREAIEGHIACLKAMGQPIPEETNPPQTIRIDVAA